MIGVIGAGSWGTALAVHLARSGQDVRLWARDPDIAAAIVTARRNPWYLSDVELPERLHATGDMTQAVAGAECVIVAVPSEFFACTVKRLAGLTTGVPVVSATKGFDPERHVRMTEVLTEGLPESPVAALSGPTFAREVAQGLPAAAVLATRDDVLAAALQARLGTRQFRLYTNRDVIGVEAGGALKNVIAIAAGIADGLGLGANARAALVTRGLAEITRLAVALGASPATLAGLAGLGDLVLTCTGTLSRNHQLGRALASGQTLEAATAATRMVAEGVPTVRSALALAGRHGIRVPIATEVAAVAFGGKSASGALGALLGRPWTREDAA